jgi:hypothetical protein
MDWIDKLVLAHVMHSPSAVAASVAALVYLDRAIMFALKFVTAKQADSVIDGVAAALKSRVDADAAQPPKP